MNDTATERAENAGHSEDTATEHKGHSELPEQKQSYRAAMMACELFLILTVLGVWIFVESPKGSTATQNSQDGIQGEKQPSADLTKFTPSGSPINGQQGQAAMDLNNPVKSKLFSKKAAVVAIAGSLFGAHFRPFGCRTKFHAAILQG